MKIIVLLGLPGAGKTTHARLLSEHFEYLHISTGDIIREEIQKQTTLGNELAALIDEGFFAPDELMNRLITEIIKQNHHSNGIIFDGYPRTIKQLLELEEILQKNHIEKTYYFFLDAPEELVVRRLLKRAISSGRIDDNEEVIKNRLLVFADKSYPVIDLLKSTNEIITIDVTKSIETVEDSIQSYVSLP